MAVMPFQVLRSYIHTYIHTCMHAYMHTYIHTYIMVLSNLSVSDVSNYFVWLTALLVIHTFPSGVVHISDTEVTQK